MRAPRIYEGASEVQRTIIAKELYATDAQEQSAMGLRTPSTPPTLPAHRLLARRHGHRRHLVFLAGQTALDADGKVVGGTLPEQFEPALANLLAALRRRGRRPGRPRPRHRLRHGRRRLPRPRPRTRPIWRRLAGRDYPAMAVVGAVRLWDEQGLVELDGIAVLD